MSAAPAPPAKARPNAALASTISVPIKAAKSAIDFKESSLLTPNASSVAPASTTFCTWKGVVAAIFVNAPNALAPSSVLPFKATSLTCKLSKLLAVCITLLAPAPNTAAPNKFLNVEVNSDADCFVSSVSFSYLF